MPSSTSSESSRFSRPSHRSALAAQRTDIFINCYDLLPPGKLSSILWAIGGSLLHSGIVVGNREYAYGGHDKRGLTGVYYTKPRLEPPGGTFRIEILQGFTVRSAAEIDDVIKEASEQFQGTSYNLLTKNCNHFTSYLCEKLTGRPAPKWLNRAASIGVALPCVVPRDWVSPPEYDTVDGELLGEEEEAEDDDERSRMLRREQWRKLERKASDEDQASWNSEMDRIGGRRSESSVGSGSTGMRRARYADEEAPRPVILKDSSGREVPAAERALAPKPRR